MVKPKLVSSGRIAHIVEYASRTTFGEHIDQQCNYLRTIGDKNDTVTYREYLAELKNLKASKAVHSRSNRKTLNEINHLIPLFRQKVREGSGEKSLINLVHGSCSYSINDVYRR